MNNNKSTLLIGYLSSVLVLASFIYLFYMYERDTSFMDYPPSSQTKPFKQRKAPVLQDVFSYTLGTRGLIKNEVFVIEPTQIQTKGKWTVAMIGLLGYRRDSLNGRDGSGSTEFHYKTGAFLKQIYSWVDHKTTDIVFVNAAVPDSKPEDVSGFYSCGDKCYDRLLLGGVSTRVESSYFYTTQVWLTTLIQGASYMDSRWGTPITSMPYYVIFDPNENIRDIVRGVSTEELYKKLLALQYKNIGDHYSESFIKTQKQLPIPNYLDWMRELI